MASPTAARCSADPVVAPAIVDRLIENAVVINIHGRNYGKAASTASVPKNRAATIPRTPAKDSKTLLNQLRGRDARVWPAAREVAKFVVMSEELRDHQQPPPVFTQGLVDATAAVRLR